LGGGFGNFLTNVNVYKSITLTSALSPPQIIVFWWISML